MFEKFGFGKKEIKSPKREVSEGEQLLQIIGDIEQSPELFKFLINQLADQSGEDQEEVKEWFKEAQTSANALGLAKKIDELLGSGTFRKLSFVSKGADAERNVLKILSKDLKSKSFEGQAEKGLYLNIKENYGVEWNLEKAARDILQNFFDGNGQILDGVEIQTIKEGDIVEVKIHGDQEYDWRELVHLGGSTKTESETTAGGFGEGTKILSLVLLRDFGAKKVKFSSKDWKVEFYIDRVPQGSYRNEEDRGLFVKKRKKTPEEGNKFELEFIGEKAEEKAKSIEKARDLFFSSQNSDFKNPSFENKETGGFSILPRNKDKEFNEPEGNLYIAGQRIHYDTRDRWNNIDLINIWTWKKVTPKDRDRGRISSIEMEDLIIPLIVNSMSMEDCKKSVRDFEQWFDKIRWAHEPNFKLLEAIVNRMHKEGVKMEFKKEFLANDIPFGARWIDELLRSKGYIMAPNFLSKIGMITAIEQFKKLQEHNRVEETETERRKIELLKEATKLMGFPEEDQKDVWVFGAEAEKNIFHGQYNPEFFWLARELLAKSFFDALHTYLHEAAHKAGPHGNAQFEYTLQEYIKKIQLWMHTDKDKYEQFSKEWENLK